LRLPLRECVAALLRDLLRVAVRVRLGDAARVRVREGGAVLVAVAVPAADTDDAAVRVWLLVPVPVAEGDVVPV